MEDYEGLKDFMVKSFPYIIIVDQNDKKNVKMMKKAFSFYLKIWAIFKELVKNKGEREFYWWEYIEFLE